ncbi:MAG: hypothetical protein HYZ28_00795 [Myxococcales bacterium]|nr:hypothetical protein [Myxococcales bacterium]
MVVALTAGVAVAAFALAGRAAEQRDELISKYSRDLVSAGQIRYATERLVATSRGYLLAREPGLLTNVQAAEAALLSRLDELDQLPNRQEVLELVAQVRLASSDYLEALHQVMAQQQAGPDRRSMADVFEAVLLPKRQALERAAAQLVARQEQELAQGRQQARATTSRQLRLMAGLGSLAIGLAIFLSWRTAKRLSELYEAERRATQEAERAVAARQDLLGVVAHDLRSPLQAIVMKAGLIERAPEKASDYAQAIVGVAKRMASLTDSLLDTASIEAGRLTIAPGECRVSEILAAAKETFAEAAGGKSIHLEHAVEPADLVVFADPQRLLQVLSNLLGNAIKFTGAGGRISVRAFRTGESVQFAVSDTGPGISAENLPHLFERYWKADAGERSGAGLGLYISRGIVQAHGGRLWVESRLGEGSTFLFELPAGRW